MKHAAFALLLLLMAAQVAQAQTTPAGPDPINESARLADPSRWVWSVDSNVFFGFNYQHRRFRDFHAWESQNWLMGMLERRAGRGTLAWHAMLSLESVTLRDLGSPQVFQTGETFRGAPLIDYQHPHDLFMGLGAEYRRPIGRVTTLWAVDAVGSPSLGPPAFMHRPSARDNPQAPLAHHYLDSTHITPGVVRAGVEAGAWRGEVSWYRGREPDENRLDLDLGALDSGAVRVSWNRGGWSAQVSAAYATQPEIVTPYDEKKVTASIAHTKGDEERGVSWMAAFGQDREIHGNLEAYLFEASIRAGASSAMYARAESVAKDILDVGFHPRGVFHRHRQSQVSAFTLGYVHDVRRTPAGLFGIGTDLTAYAVPSNLKESYGSPLSFHIFLRYRALRREGASAVHIHTH